MQATIDPRPGRGERRVPGERAAVIGLLCIVVVALFARTLHDGLYLDDYHLARHWSLGEVVRAFHGRFDASGFNPDYFRPLAGVSLGLDWSIWGLTTWGFHVTNLVLHAGAASVVYLVARTLPVRRWAAVLAGVYFVVVPSNVATAVYIAERTDALAAIWIGVGMLVLRHYHSTRQPRWLVVLTGLFVLALLSKEIGLAFLPFAAALWWYLSVDDPAPATQGAAAHAQSPATTVGHWRGEVRAWLTPFTARARLRQWLLVLGPLVLTAAVYLVYRQAVLAPGSLSDHYGEAQANPLHALARGVAWTFKGVPWEVRAWSLPALVALFLVAVVMAPRSPAWRIVLLGMLWMIAGVLPLTFNGGTEPRLLYVAQIGMATAVAGVTSVIADGVAARRAARGRRGAAGGLAVAVAVAVAVAITTLVGTVQAQDQFEPGSAKRNAADLSVWTNPAKREVVLPAYLNEIEQQLVAAGLVAPDGAVIAAGP